MVVILGGRGYVATALAAACQRAGIPHRVLSRSETDYTHPPALEAALAAIRPDYLMNAAGYTGFPNVSASEKNKPACLMANTALPAVVSSVCRKLGLPWGHISTGCIFSGTGPDGGGFREDDAPNFTFQRGGCSFYSGTKALAEEILAADPTVHIWRIRRPFTHTNHPKNTLSKLLDYPVLVNISNSYSQMDEAADACLRCFTHQLPAGIYHVVNPGGIDARTIATMAAQHGLARHEYRFVDSCAELPGFDGVPRAESLLNPSKIIAAGARLTPVEQAVVHAFQRWQ